MRSLVFAAATVLTGSLFAADPGLVSLAMPDTQVMAGVNAEQVRLSPLGQFLQAQTAEHPDPGLEKLIETTGFDPRRDLREILIASSGQSMNAQAVILARGTFNIPKILEAVQADGATIETYKDVSIIKRSKQDFLAFPDSTLAISGEDAIVRAAIDRLTAPTAISSALAVQVNQLSTTEDAWFVSLAPLSQFQPQPGAAPTGADPLAMMSNVQQASGGVKFGANVVVTLQAVSATDLQASALATVLKAMSSGMAKMGGSVNGIASAASLLQNLNVTAEGKTTTISLSVPESQIEEMIKTARANEPSRESTKQLQTRPAPAPAAPGTGYATLGGPVGVAGAVPQRIHVAREVQKAKLIQHADPVYPPLAVQARISGVVRLNAIIGKDGTVQNLTVASGHPLLVAPAMEAVKQWVYEPTLLNGQAVEVATQVEVNFTLEP